MLIIYYCSSVLIMNLLFLFSNLQFDISSSGINGDDVTLPNDSASVRSPEALRAPPAPRPPLPQRNTKKVAVRGRAKRRAVEKPSEDDTLSLSHSLKRIAMATLRSEHESSQQSESQTQLKHANFQETANEYHRAYCDLTTALESKIILMREKISDLEKKLNQWKDPSHVFDDWMAGTLLEGMADKILEFSCGETFRKILNQCEGSMNTLKAAMTCKLFCTSQLEIYEKEIEAMKFALGKLEDLKGIHETCLTSN
ncbi:hypothetical protein PIB30_106457 [Stylosanthes scabra]|uniref:Uncharacterized protein n=1 Tax=Stylosanthes scabra TaxID=79078 RepID=A0ABU6YXN4_9FABA|nr:hypothetical protein [Stylosanthes scabra]